MNKYFKSMFVAFAVLVLAFPMLARADGEAYNRVDLQAESSVEVSNDLMVVQMSAEIQDKEPAVVASRIASVMNLSMKVAASYPAVKVTSGWQSSYPVYGKDNQLDGWRGAAQIKIVSGDFKAAGELIGMLQNSLQISGVDFSVSDESRQKAEDGLIASAVEAFKRRADVVTTALGGTGYRIVKMNTSNAGGQRPHPMMVGFAAKARDEAVPAQDFAGGSSRFEVRVSGTIEVIGKKG